MTFLPIVERELRVAARLNATYRNRSIVAGIVTLVAMVMFAFGAFAAAPSRVGYSMFWTLAYLALVFCVLEGVRKTADCLSEENREGTLGLLFLTDLKGYDVVFGKLAGKSLTSIYGLFSVLPILALSLLLGGITGDEYWRIVLALVNILFFSLCAGIFVSSWHRDDQKAMAATFLLVVACGIIPLFAPAPYSNISPLHAFNAADESHFLVTPSEFWWPLLITQGMCWTMLLWASLAVPNCWRKEKFKGPSTGALRLFPGMGSGNSRSRSRQQQYMLARNPAFWLAARQSPGPVRLFFLVLFSWGATVALTFCFKLEHLPVYLGICWVTNFLLKMRVAAQACHCLAEARRNSALELLLATPLTSEAIIRGQILALQRTFGFPIVAMLFLQLAGLLVGVSVISSQQHDNSVGFVIIGFMVYLALFVLDVCAVTWAGMWYGLSCKSEGQAVTRTIFLVLLLPFVCMLIPCYGFPFVIGLPIMFMVNGSSNVRRKFRELAGQRYTAPTDSGLRPVVPVQTVVPPPISVPPRI